MPWYCLFTDLSTTWGYGVKVQPNALCHWEYTGEYLSITFDIRNGTDALALHGRKLLMAVLVSQKYEGNVALASYNFCRLMCDAPRTVRYPVYGGNDWYCNYGNSSHTKVIRLAQKIAECAPQGENRPYMVVDTGWQLYTKDHEGCCAGGPWEPNEHFEDMEKLAKELKDMGILPGIWLRTLLWEEEIPREHILRKDGTANVMDPSHPEVLAMIRKNIRKLVNWGYQMIKHDFSTYDIFGSFGFQVQEDMFRKEVHFSDKTKTTAQIIKNFYQTIRDAATEDTVIIGCNTIPHLSAGLFELQRTGDDTSGLEWARTKKMGVNTLAFRMMQHNAFYQVDADCVGITKQIPWEINKRWLDILSKSGTPLFVSIGEDSYTEEVKHDIQEAFRKASDVHNPSEPLDFIENRTPTKWRSDFGTDEYCWE